MCLQWSELPLEEIRALGVGEEGVVKRAMKPMLPVQRSHSLRMKPPNAFSGRRARPRMHFWSRPVSALSPRWGSNATAPVWTRGASSFEAGQKMPGGKKSGRLPLLWHVFKRSPENGTPRRVSSKIRDYANSKLCSCRRWLIAHKVRFQSVSSIPETV